MNSKYEKKKVCLRKEKQKNCNKYLCIQAISPYPLNHQYFLFTGSSSIFAKELLKTRMDICRASEQKVNLPSNYC